MRCGTGGGADAIPTRSARAARGGPAGDLHGVAQRRCVLGGDVLRHGGALSLLARTQPDAGRGDGRRLRRRGRGGGAAGAAAVVVVVAARRAGGGAGGLDGGGADPAGGAACRGGDLGGGGARRGGVGRHLADRRELPERRTTRRRDACRDRLVQRDMDAGNGDGAVADADRQPGGHAGDADPVGGRQRRGAARDAGACPPARVRTSRRPRRRRSGANTAPWCARRRGCFR